MRAGQEHGRCQWDSHEPCRDSDRSVRSVHLTTCDSGPGIRATSGVNIRSSLSSRAPRVCSRPPSLPAGPSVLFAVEVAAACWTNALHQRIYDTRRKPHFFNVPQHGIPRSNMHIYHTVVTRALRSQTREEDVAAVPGTVSICGMRFSCSSCVHDLQTSHFH